VCCQKSCLKVCFQFMQAFRCRGYDALHCVGSFDYEKCEKALFSETITKEQPQ